MALTKEELKEKIAIVEDDYCEALVASGLSPSAAKTYFASIRKMVRIWLTNGAVTQEDLADHEAMMTLGYASTFRTAWRKFVGLCEEAGIANSPPLPHDKTRNEPNSVVGSVARFVNGRLDLREMTEAKWGDVSRDASNVYVQTKTKGRYSFFGPIAHHAFDALALWGHKSVNPPANAALFPPRPGAIESVSIGSLKAWVTAARPLLMPDDHGLEISGDILNAIRTVLAAGIPQEEVLARILNEARFTIPEHKRPEAVEQKVVDEEAEGAVEQGPIAVKMPSFDEWRRNR